MLLEMKINELLVSRVAAQDDTYLSRGTDLPQVSETIKKNHPLLFKG
jgi:hypothetical protein